jgi:dihydrofolate reductase
MEINLIFAQGIDGAFGLNNQLPWRCPSDLAYFKH